MEKKNLENQREERIRKFDQASNACKMLGWSTPTSPSEFSERVTEARNAVEAWQQQSESSREMQFSLSNKKKEAETEFLNVNKEIRVLRLQPSNIPAEMLELRQTIAAAIRVNEAKLPFVGELIEVKPDELEWQGAIERVLQGFALSVLVTEEHYLSFSQFVNNNNLGRRLVYYRTGSAERERLEERNRNHDRQTSGANSLIFKVNLKSCEQSEWLLNELRNRFDYTCVDSIQAFRNHERALTREGQVKHNRHRHEKDDRFAISDRRRWALGFDNREKLNVYEKQAQKLAQEISDFADKMSGIEEQERKLRINVIHYHTIANLQWQEIDVVTPMSRIDAINRQLKETREDDPKLQKIHEQLERQKSIVEESENAVVAIKVKNETVLGEKKANEDKLASILQHPIMTLTPSQTQGLDLRFEQASKNLSSKSIELDNIDRIAKEVLKKMNVETGELKQEINKSERVIENRFAEFKHLWPMEASDVDASLESAPDYFAKLTRLQQDGLPEHEHKFFTLLQDQSDQNLAALATHLNQARKDILERMEIVNKSLSKVPFNKNQDRCTYLSIEVSDRQLVEVKEFKQEIQTALSHAWSEDRAIAEARFTMLKSLVEKLSSQDPTFKRWRDTVLDVRLHVEFIGREIDESGIEIEIYRSGAGKSGGQRQKLATTCLAAALRYQLGGEDGGMPMYSPVILDEAFDKADNDFTALAMNIFTNFGFQMIVATPLKSVMTLEPFIGGACFVDIRNRRDSSIKLIDWDSEQGRLKLPQQQHAGSSHQTERA